MNKTARYLFACIATCSFLMLFAACGENETENGVNTTAAPAGAGSDRGERPGDAADPAGAAGDVSSQESAVTNALRTLAASEGIYFGEIPEDFPTNLLPPYPGGTITQAAIQDDGATLLQIVPATKEKVYDHYRAYYKKIKITAAEPVTIMGKTMVGFSGKNAEISMTLKDNEDGTTFVALAF